MLGYKLLTTNFKQDNQWFDSRLSLALPLDIDEGCINPISRLDILHHLHHAELSSATNLQMTTYIQHIRQSILNIATRHFPDHIPFDIEGSKNTADICTPDNRHIIAHPVQERTHLILSFDDI